MEERAIKVPGNKDISRPHGAAGGPLNTAVIKRVAVVGWDTFVLIAT